MKKIWVNAGELSGDIQSAEFLKEFKKLLPELDAVGMGGEHLEGAGMRCLFRIEDLSVMGIYEVLSALPRIISLLSRIKKSLAEEKPDLIILTDAPDFNFFVARFAQKLNIPVIYFIPPKVWAWRSGRVKFLKKYIKKIYCILPFEADFYQKHQINAEYVGNPLVSLVDYENIAHIAPDYNRIGLMPGSRKKEVESLLPEFAKASELLIEKFPDLEFYLIRASHFSEEYIRSFWQSKVKLNFVSPQNRYAFMRSCACIMAASGTAVLETALAGVPTLVTYKVSPFSYALGKRFVKVPWISLPNLIMKKEIFPEYIQENAKGENFSKIIETWLDAEESFLEGGGDSKNFVEKSYKRLERIREECSELRKICGDGKSAFCLASSILTTQFLADF